MGAAVIMAVVVATGAAVLVAGAAIDVFREWWQARRPFLIWRPATRELICDNTGRVLRFRSWRAAQRFIGRMGNLDVCPVRSFRVRVFDRFGL